MKLADSSNRPAGTTMCCTPPTSWFWSLAYAKANCSDSPGNSSIRTPPSCTSPLRSSASAASCFAGKTKTETSEAPLPLPDLCIAALKLRRQQQDADRDRAGDTWHETGLVFTTRYGTPIEPRNFSRSFDRRIAQAGIPAITVHGARKTCGSLLAALDVHPHVAMQILRHSKIAANDGDLHRDPLGRHP